jgi:hypothetical protein
MSGILQGVSGPSSERPASRFPPSLRRGVLLYLLASLRRARTVVCAGSDPPAREPNVTHLSLAVSAAVLAALTATAAEAYLDAGDRIVAVYEEQVIAPQLEALDEILSSLDR